LILVVIIIPVITNSFIFLVYDSYLKKSPERLNEHEKMLYEKFFEEDLETEERNYNLNLSFSETEDEPDIRENKEKSKKLNFSDTFLKGKSKQEIGNTNDNGITTSDIPPKNSVSENIKKKKNN
jgi:hypothetical protein